MQRLYLLSNVYIHTCSKQPSVYALPTNLQEVSMTLPPGSQRTTALSSLAMSFTGDLITILNTMLQNLIPTCVASVRFLTEATSLSKLMLQGGTVLNFVGTWTYAHAVAATLVFSIGGSPVLISVLFSCHMPLVFSSPMHVYQHHCLT